MVHQFISLAAVVQALRCRGAYQWCMGGGYWSSWRQIAAVSWPSAYDADSGRVMCQGVYLPSGLEDSDIPYG